jgi:hypothetical protein
VWHSLQDSCHEVFQENGTAGSWGHATGEMGIAEDTLDPVTPSNRLGTLADDLHINTST